MNFTHPLTTTKKKKSPLPPHWLSLGKYEFFCIYICSYATILSFFDVCFNTIAIWDGFLNLNYQNSQCVLCYNIKYPIIMLYSNVIICFILGWMCALSWSPLRPPWFPGGWGVSSHSHTTGPCGHFMLPITAHWMPLSFLQCLSSLTRTSLIFMHSLHLASDVTAQPLTPPLEVTHLKSLNSIRRTS